MSDLKKIIECMVHDDGVGVIPNNTVESDEFDLEWAERGGILTMVGDTDQISLYRYVDSDDCEEGHKFYAVHLESKTIAYWRCSSMRMATPLEVKEYNERTNSNIKFVEKR